MLIEVKSNKRHGSYQKATRQLFIGKESLEKIFSAIGATTKWQYVGVFFALIDDDTCFFECDNCSNFVIVGEEEIFKKFKIVEEKVAEKNQDWKPEEHVGEFIALAKETLFIAQGDPYAPVTGSNIIDKTVKHVFRASTPQNIFYWTRFWTLEQLSIVQALDILYLFLDAFYSTGKTEVLKCFGKHKLDKDEIVHYFNQRPKGMDQNSLLPFTLVLQKEFPTEVVKETSFQFGVDSVKDFLKQYGIEPTHHVIFDEVICTRYNKAFIDSIVEMKNNVASLWIAMGAQPITGR